MNYLAHLHIADHCKSQLLGNLLGDFVRGNVQERFPVDVVNGIYMHRWVDAYTDSHPIVLQAKQLFPEKLKRFAPIALDMFWDHCLSCHWSRYHAKPLVEFIDDAEAIIRRQQQTVRQSASLPDAFVSVNEKIWSARWLESYQDFDNIGFALRQIASRRARLDPLRQCISTLTHEYAQLERLFFEFYPRLLNAAQGE